MYIVNECLNYGLWKLTRRWPFGIPNMIWKDQSFDKNSKIVWLSTTRVWLSASIHYRCIICSQVNCLNEKIVFVEWHLCLILGRWVVVLPSTVRVTFSDERLRKHRITTGLGHFSPSSCDFDGFLTISGNSSCSNRSWKSFNYFRIIFSLEKAVDCAIFHIFPDFFKGWPIFLGYIFPDHWLGEIGSWIFTQ